MKEKTVSNRNSKNHRLEHIQRLLKDRIVEADLGREAFSPYSLSFFSVRFPALFLPHPF